MDLVREIDQMGREVWLPSFPKRIVSVVPSQTELLYDLGLANRIVGQTLFCVHPLNYFKKANKVGGTKRLQLEKIRSLRPDLIIGNKEENEREQIEALSLEFPVWMSDIKTPADAIEMIRCVGKITQSAASANRIADLINRLIEPNQRPPHLRQTAVYLIWKNPWMAAGDDTYIHEMLKLAGYQNLIKGRYPEVQISEIKELQPQHVLLSSEPYPFKEEHLNELKLQLPECNISLVDGELYSWYGSRMIYALEKFHQIKH